MTNVYKIKLFRYDIEGKNKNDYRDFCIDQKLLAVGWPCTENRVYKDVDDYIEAVNKTPNRKGVPYGETTAWVRARECMKKMGKDNFCWTQKDGNTYFLGKILDESNLFNGNEFCKDLEKELEKYYLKHNEKKDSINLSEFGLWRHCDWMEVKFDDVPGNVIASLAAQGTASQISSKNENDFYEYCQYLYDGTIPSNKLDFWNLVHYDDLEDLVGLYLQTIGYYIFPSTNKQGTKDYEYKLIHKNKDSKASKHQTAIIQCKHTDNIDIKKLEKYEDNIFLLIINGNIKWGENGEPEDKEEWICKNEKGEKMFIGWQYRNGKIKEFDKDRLHVWAKGNMAIMPERIRKFLELSKNPVII